MEMVIPIDLQTMKLTYSKILVSFCTMDETVFTYISIRLAYIVVRSTAVLSAGGSLLPKRIFRRKLRNAVQ